MPNFNFLRHDKEKKTLLGKKHAHAESIVKEKDRN